MATNSLFELLQSGEWDLPPEAVGALLDEGGITSAAEGQQAMALALQTHQSGVIATLLDRQVGVDFIDSLGRNAAHRLVSDLARNELDAWAGMTHTTPPAQLFAKLKTAGVDLNAPDAEGVTPLGLAAMAGPRSMSTFRTVLEAGANPNTPSTISSSPDGVISLLGLAASKWAEGFGYPLLHGVSPIMFLVSVDDAERLLAKGANPNGEDESANSPLMTPRYASLIADLLARGADANHRNALGQTPLMRQTDVDAVRLLLAAQADPNAQDHEGRTVLHAHLGSKETLRMLFAAGALPKDGLMSEAHRRFAGRTPAHDVFAQLIAHGANPNELVIDQVSHQLRPVWLVALRSHRAHAHSILSSLATRSDFQPSSELLVRAREAVRDLNDPRLPLAIELLHRPN